MAFNPKMVAAIKEKAKLGIVPKNPNMTQNILNQIPNLVNSSPIAPIANPMANATTATFRPQLPGIPAPKMPGVQNPLAPKTVHPKRFGSLKRKLGGY